MANRDLLNQNISIFVLIFCAKFIVASGEEKCEKQDDYYMMRSYDTDDLVLDAAEPEQLRVQRFNGSQTQLWKFKSAGRPGVYFIVNKQHGKVLDFKINDQGTPLAVVTELQKNLQQQWHFSIKGHLVNVAKEKNIDVRKADYTPGTPIIVWENNGCSCQRFVLQKEL